MALPSAVARAEQLADKLYAEAYGTQGEPAAATPPATEPAPAAAPPATEPPQDTWESRYKTLTGKYNAEVPRLAADNRTLKETVNELTAKVGTLSKQIEDVQTHAPAEPLIKPEEIAEFGEPLVDMARRAAKEVLAQAQGPSQREVAEIRSELTDLKKSAGEIQWQNFIDLVTSLCADWAQINVNPDFLTWLDGVDEFSGMSRQQLLDRAKDARDAARVARFFNGWKEANQTKAATSRNALEAQVVPDSSSRTVVPTGKQIISRGQIAQFYNDVRAGKYSDADVSAMEAEISAAVAEGRVR